MQVPNDATASTASRAVSQQDLSRFCVGSVQAFVRNSVATGGLGLTASHKGVSPRLGSSNQSPPSASSLLSLPTEGAVFLAHRVSLATMLPGEPKPWSPYQVDISATLLTTVVLHMVGCCASVGQSTQHAAHAMHDSRHPQGHPIPIAPKCSHSMSKWTPAQDLTSHAACRCR